MIKLNVGLSIAWSFLQNTETNHCIGSNMSRCLDSWQVDVNINILRNVVGKPINHEERTEGSTSDVKLVVRANGVDVSVKIALDSVAE